MNPTLRRVLRGLAFSAACLLSVDTLLGVLSIQRQLGRDQECREELTAYLRKFETHRARKDRVPSDEIELSVPSGRLSLISVWTMDTHSEKLRPRGATHDRDFIMNFERSDSSVSYESWSNEDMCDGGNRAFAYAFPSVMVPLSGLMFWLALRRPNRAPRNGQV